MDPPSIEGNDPVILTGLILKEKEVHFLPAGKGVPRRKLGGSNVTLYPAFGGYGILKRVVDSTPEEYYKALWSKSAEVPVWIGSCGYGDPFDVILEGFSVTKFGGERVTRGAEEALVTLADVVGLIRDGRLSTHMSTDDVCSVPIAIEQDAPIVEAIKKMISHNIRRLFLQDGQGKFVSDRALVDYMSSPGRLEMAKVHPEGWIDGQVSALATKNPGRCRTGDLDDAARLMGQAPDDCLMTDEGALISRWDLVVKPWRAGKLGIEEN